MYSSALVGDAYMYSSALGGEAYMYTDGRKDVYQSLLDLSVLQYVSHTLLEMYSYGETGLSCDIDITVPAVCIHGLHVQFVCRISVN